MTDFNALLTEGRPEKASAALSSYQNAQAQAAASLAFPGRKTEDWKYSAKRLGDLTQLATAAGDTRHAPTSDIDSDAYRITLLDGQVIETPQTPSGLKITRLGDISDAQAQIFANGVVASNSSLEFATLNGAEFSDGVFIEIDDHVTLDKPVQILTAQVTGGLCHARVFLKLGKLAQCTLIEEIKVSPDNEDSTCLLNAVVDVELGDAAQLTYIRMDIEQHNAAKVIAATGVNMGRNARFYSHALGLGAVLKRHDLRVAMTQPGAECSLNGVCVTRDKQHYDNHTCIEHIAPHCQSDENYRCIADHQSQIVFNGRIHIHRDAQKTLGSMSNKNLLLSNQAEIDSKPELEIYADDVKCAHGTTIGQLDEQEIYYLKTRGISDELARHMLTLGFVLEIVQSNPIEAIAEYWQTVLSEQLRFEQD